ncbi:uncharacterized protein LOC112539434 [Tetranychus urticae]|uniref:uncharacterized protein LOC112539434 n=1 Tax=Tetranychus urticae TaxID=32264 RepID=UPI000D651387|nr:uncharacterized protein LOC112539434 [Tetranychus urticae]
MISKSSISSLPSCESSTFSSPSSSSSSTSSLPTLTSIQCKPSGSELIIYSSTYPTALPSKEDSKDKRISQSSNEEARIGLAKRPNKLPCDSTVITCSNGGEECKENGNKNDYESNDESNGANEGGDENDGDEEEDPSEGFSDEAKENSGKQCKVKCDGNSCASGEGKESSKKGINGIMKSATSPVERKKRARVEFSNIVNERRASNITYSNQNDFNQHLNHPRHHYRESRLSVLITSSASTVNMGNLSSGHGRSSRRYHSHADLNSTQGSGLNDDEGRRGSDLMRLFTRRRSRSPTSLSAASCRRLQQPRLSLLGKPIVPRSIKQRDPRYRRTQILIHNLLERPRGKLAVIYHLLHVSIKSRQSLLGNLSFSSSSNLFHFLSR